MGAGAGGRQPSSVAVSDVDELRQRIARAVDLPAGFAELSVLGDGWREQRAVDDATGAWLEAVEQSVLLRWLLLGLTSLWWGFGTDWAIAQTAEWPIMLRVDLPRLP